MKTTKDYIPFQVIIVDDNDFYNKLLSRGIQKKSDEYLQKYGVLLQLSSFTHLDDFLEKVNFEIRSFIFLDYYLDNNQVANTAIKAIREKSPNSTIVIISQEFSFQTSVDSIFNGANEFIQKGTELIVKAHKLIDVTFNNLQIEVK